MTLVYQSYRTQNVPAWINRCLETVQNWTKAKGYEYRFIDDELFEYAPLWYRNKVKNNVQLVSDLSRLILARNFLREGYDRVIWMDADLLIFDAENFHIESKDGAHFCREIWMDEDLNGRIVHQEKINNSVSVFHQGGALLEFYIDACLKLVNRATTTPPVLVGTSFLTALQKIYPFQVIRNVGIISPALVYDIVNDERDFIEKYIQWHGADIHAANLCGSMKNQIFRGMDIDHSAMEEVVARLTSSGTIAI